MTRKNRVWYPNVMMHITSRGNRRNDIFRDDEDFQVYLNTLEYILEKMNAQFELISYVLMSNHVHLQVQTKEMHIRFFMGRLNNLYAKYFNNKYNYVGHLFQERYGSEIISDDKYVLEVSRYIHLNPVRANMVKKPNEYRWSSYSMYIGEKEEKLINAQAVMHYYPKNSARKLYKIFVEQGIKIEEISEDNSHGISS
jgi:putative transposase